MCLNRMNCTRAPIAIADEYSFDTVFWAKGEMLMTRITLADDRTTIDLGAVAVAFGLNIDELESRLRDGTITRWFECGTGDHDNKAQLVFYSHASAIRVVVDENGIVQSSPSAPDKQATSHRKHGAISTRNETMANDQPNKPTTTETDAARRARLDALLDAALEGTFPASDPIAISFEGRKPARPAHGDAQ